MEGARRLGPVVVVAAAAVGAAMWFSARAPEPPPLEMATAPSAVASDQITVHVSGAVARPGLVTVGTGGRVADAIAAAGGAAPGADLGRLNLAATIGDGQQVVVPQQTPAGSGGAPPDAPPGDGLVRLNAASATELQELPGVGPVLAERIVAYREANGPFGAVEDLLDVPGIGEGKLAALRDAAAVP